eukprot:13603980-Heterocapsa_arctica.AAC.1
MFLYGSTLFYTFPTHFYKCLNISIPKEAAAIHYGHSEVWSADTTRSRCGSCEVSGRVPTRMQKMRPVAPLDDKTSAGTG